MAAEDRERLLEHHREQQRNREDRQAAQRLIQQAAAGADGVAAADADGDGYWEVIGNPDIGREAGADEHLDEFLRTELARTFALGNLTRREWHSWAWRIETEVWSTTNEFRDPDSALDDGDMAEMYGETRPVLTDERARRLRSAMQVKKLLTSLSISARGLRAGTEIHGVVRSEEPTDEEESGGFLSGVKQRIT